MITPNQSNQVQKSKAYRDQSGKGLVCGIGIYEPRRLCMTDTPEVSKMYAVWNGMLRRAEQKYMDKYPTYAGVSVSPEFHHFADFSEWAMRQDGWNIDGFQLDKDLLVKGNKVYSPSTCVFLPKEINVLLTKGDKMRGELPIGVKRNQSGGFGARVKIQGKEKGLGTFPDPTSAFLAYKRAKEAHMKYMAEMYRHDIDKRAYEALINYKVEITD